VTRRKLAVFVLLAVVSVVGLLLVRDRLTASGSLDSDGSRPTISADRAPIVVDAAGQRLLGVRTVRATMESLPHSIRTVGTVKYDETRVVDVNLKVEGWIRHLDVNYTGQKVTKNQPLFTLYSPDLISAQTQLIAAVKSREQMIPQQVIDQPYLERLIDTPRERLVRWDVPRDQIAIIERTHEVMEAVLFRSPAAGVVIEKAALEGMHVAPGATLYKLADLSVVWVEADVYEADLSRLRVGQPAVVTVDAWRDQKFSGRIVHIYPYVTEQTRTVKARVELSNREGRLKPGMFATVEVAVGGSTGLVVPMDAVVDSGTRQLVFVAKGEQRFEPRDVTLGARSEGRVQILSGLRENEEVAARGTFFLDSESQMRAALENYQSPSSQAAPTAERGVELILRTDPDPLRAGENIFEVTAQDADKHPLTDAEIHVVFFMPAMPSMHMPAMRSEARLASIGPGLYRGSGTILMPGRWDVTLTARRGEQAIGTNQTTVIAR
jgi:multidrug efflux pump subunit AcrA (membrane-fusion protein)